MSNLHRQTRLYKTVCRVGRVSWTLDLERVPTVADSVHTARRDQTVFPARRYASAGTSYSPVSVCLSVCVCLSGVGVLSKRMNGLIWFLAWRLFSTSLTLCFKESQVSTKIRVLPSGT